MGFILTRGQGKGKGKAADIKKAMKAAMNGLRMPLSTERKMYEAYRGELDSVQAKQDNTL
jgi:hypothetical protein